MYNEQNAMYKLCQAVRGNTLLKVSSGSQLFLEQTRYDVQQYIDSKYARRLVII